MLGQSKTEKFLRSHPPRANTIKMEKPTSSDNLSALGSIVPIQTERFEFDDKKAFDYLKEYGFVVFKNIATKEEISTATDLFWDWAERISPSGKLTRKDPNSWGSSDWPGTSRQSRGVLYEFGIGQSAFMWFCRSIPKVKQIFELVWEGEEDLTSSLDGCGVFRPAEVNPEWVTSGGWFHVVQNGNNRKGKCCVQGFLNLIRSGEDDGGFVVIPKSHQSFEELFEGSNAKKDFYLIPNTHKIWVFLSKQNCKSIKVCADEGDFVMWDSRSIHCSVPASIKTDSTQSQSKSEIGLRRLVAYICMLPSKFLATPKVVEQKIAAFMEGATLSHWATEIHVASTCSQEIYKPITLSSYQQMLLSGTMYGSIWKWKKFQKKVENKDVY
jgi:hypothetical protein